MLSYGEFIEYMKKKGSAEYGIPPEQTVFYPEGYTSEDPAMLDWIRAQNLRCFQKENDALLTDHLVIYDSAQKDIAKSSSLPIRMLYEDSLRDADDTPLRIRVRADVPSETLDKIFKRYAGGYPEIRSQLVIRLLNYTLHMRDLHGAVYMRVGDFALVLYQLLNHSEGLLTTSKIKQKDLVCWGLEQQKETVMYRALANTARLYPACVYDKRRQQEIDLMQEPNIRKEDIAVNGNTILLSTFQGTNGASALFYPGAAEKLMAIYGKPFAAVFMNINDVMLFEPDDPRIWSYLETARKSTAMGEMLSANCYLCSKDGIRILKKK